MKALRFWFLAAALAAALGASSFAQDLWRDSGDLFTRSAEPLAVGSVVHIEYTEPFNRSFGASLSGSAQKSLQRSGATLDLLSFLPPSGLNQNQEQQVANQFNMSEDFVGWLAARITAYEPRAQNYSLEARRLFVFDGKPTSFLLRAIVSAKDLRERWVSSDRLSSVQVFLRSKSGNKALTEEDFAEFFGSAEPKNSEGNEAEPSEPAGQGDGSVDLKDATKRRLFLEWLNLLLNGLF